MSKKNELLEELTTSLRKKESEKSYSRFGLSSNPFPVAGLPTVNLPPLDDSIKSKVVSFVASTYNNEAYSGLTIVGDYGSGKTHLLKYIKSSIDELTLKSQNREIDFDFLAVTCFIDRPEDSPQRVVHKIIEDIGIDKIRKYVWRIIIDELSLEKSNFQKKFGPRSSLFTSSNQWDELFKDPIIANYLEFLKLFKKLNGDFVKLQERMKEIINENIVHDSALADRYLGIILFSEEKLADNSWDVLAGYVSKKDIQRKEIVFLNSIVEILKKVGFKHLYVFVDEFEDIGKLSSAKKTNYLLTLITLINQSSHWSVIVSLTNDVLEEEIKKEPPLYDRLTTTRIDIKRLKFADGCLLLLRYLNLNREKPLDSIYPFNDESVRRMISLSKGNCRSFILLAYHSLEIATKQKLTEITTETVDQAKDLRGV